MNNKKSIIKNLVIALIVVGGIGALGEIQYRAKKGGEGNPKNNYELNDRADKKLPNSFEINNMASGKKRVYDFQNFKGGEINNMMGGVDLDLRDCVIDGEAVIDFSIAMGGASIIIPKDWTVIENVSAIFGGVEVQSSDSLDAMANKSKVLKLEGNVIFGGVEVKRR